MSSETHLAHNPSELTPSSHSRWKALPLEAINLTGGFWAQRQRINRQISLQHGYDMLEKAGNFHNFRVAAGLEEGQYRGREFLDSDVYKWLEAAAYDLQLNPNEELQTKVDETIELIASAQQNDGYLNTYYQLVKPDERWSDLDFGHELYCAGHLFQAAVAHYRATAATSLLEIATRFADFICSQFGPDKRPGAPGHPEIEMALVELYRVTRKRAYLDLAAFFINQRGQGKMRGLGWLSAEYHQDRVPVRESSLVEGHAVRAMYLTAGVTDLYLETGETALLTALLRQWNDMVRHKLYLTGGLGSRYEGEAFGKAYELTPDQCYCETCAAIGSIMWNWRMLRATGERRFADLMERTLYNGFLSGVALTGTEFFYINPLLSQDGDQRREWYRVACCPPNIMRLLASLGQYIATRDANGLQIHLYNSATIKTELNDERPVALTMTTEYPWQGKVKLTIRDTDNLPWQLRLRLPDWCPEVSVTLNEQVLNDPPLADGYLVLDRIWQPGDVVVLNLKVESRFIEPHPRVDAIRNSLAIQRGPLIYCLEQIDCQANLMDVRVDPASSLQASWQDELLPEGMVVVEALGYVIETDDWQDHLYRPVNEYQFAASATPVKLKAIPYYAWANRGAHAMRVWIPLGSVDN